MCTGGGFYHPNGRRPFTDREWACLQGFPVDHKFGNGNVRHQIGNAVPPSVAKKVFGHIREALMKADGVEEVEPTDMIVL